MHQAFEYRLIIARRRNPKGAPNEVLVKWNLPNNRFMLNSNDSIIGIIEIGGLGEMLKNNKDEWIIGFNSKINHTRPVLAEIYALKQGLLTAIEHNLSPIDI
ncbi:hypothetical protein R3W88_019672 [Solanum pinnatisectum]|uniref:RNase H type-1 domain-containing protein n=1 Tax=Solanum pinnatisectum TaxID=50273 RepID=A0AAV9KMV0_9SOLN|nr:hypothetical protein R3W88_019672 [Solanum pinnatisectum]